MAFHDRYHVDRTAAEEGTWVDLGDDFNIKLRRHTSAHSKAVRRKLEEPYESDIKAGVELSEEVLNEILVKQMSLSLIVDWKGKGAPDVPATPENIEKVVRDYEDFRNDIGARVMNRATFKKLVRDEDLKN